MDTLDRNDLPEWGQRVLEWLGLDNPDQPDFTGPPRRPVPPERFPWEPVPPEWRAQWGAADRPEFLIGEGLV